MATSPALVYMEIYWIPKGARAISGVNVGVTAAFRARVKARDAFY
jgi:hypothetical protein